MSDEGEKTCPLCAEEMDLTDQQLKPCKCGYEICVWCWHHIMDMAEKDDTEGRCPACRTPYNKEKIVGMAEKCERLVAEMSMERKVKSQKSKSKTSEGRKQLSSVRVIQRNLVYIMGLPLNLADEDLLQRKEYFCQYGRVMKVSISRTTTGAIQHFANNTCSVYITYSKEEEAVRCIQSVHGFTLDGRPLRACFGTTKYCHAWLRNVPCSNPDCLYLHEIGSQEDSFTKDEIISAYTRNRVQQITGATIDMQRRSGNMLPPPTDEYCYNSSDSLGKPICKSSTNNPTNGVRGSPPDGSPCRSVGLPAAASWGIRASNSQPPSSSIACSNGSFKHKPETPSESLAFLTGSRGQVSILHGDTGKKAKEESHITQHICKLEPLETVKHYINSDNRRTASEAPLTPGLPATSISNSLTRTPAYKDKEKPIRAPPSLTSSIGLSGRAGGPGPEKVLSVAAEGKIQNLSSDMSLMSLDRHQVEQQSSAEKFKGHLVSRAAGNGATSVEDCCVTREQSDLRSDPQPQVAKVALPEVEEDILSFEVQRLKDPEVISQASFTPSLSQSLHLSNDSRGYSPQLAYGSLKVNIDSQGVDKILNKGSVSIPAISNGYPENLASSSSDFDSTVQHTFLIPNDGRWKHASRFEDKVMEVDRNASVDMGESSIISNILSMDFDSWDESLTSPQNFAKLLGETDKQQGSLGASSSWKAQSNSQSRFSFAREEEYVNQVSHADSYSSNVGQFLKNHSLSHNFVNNGEFYTEKLANGFSSFNVEEPENFAGISRSHMSSNKLSVSRAQISAPPGFSGPSRAPPPGFTFHERSEQPFEPPSGNHSLDSASFLRNPYQEPSAINISSPVDIEFMDPAILAVGKGRLPGGLNSPGLDMRSNFPTQLSTYENEARLQLLMQRSFSTHQNQRYPKMGDSFSPRTDAYGLPSRIMDQTMANNMSAFPQLNIQQSRNMVMSNGHWDSWNEVQSGHDLSMAELLRNERLGSNKYYTGYEDLKFRMPSSADFYNRSYGM